MSLAEVLRQRFFRWDLRRQTSSGSPKGGPLDSPVTIVLTQRRVYVLPTGAGIAFAAALGVMLIGAINYNLSLGYALVFLLAGLGHAAILHTFRNLVGLRISPGRCEPVFVGEMAHFSIVIENTRKQQRYAIKLHLPGQPPQEIDVPAAGSAAPVLTLPAQQRGWLALPRITIAATYPLALVRAWSYAVVAQRCLIYPAPAAHAPPLPQAPAATQGASRGGSGAEDFVGLRRHQPADPPRHVAWKTAARVDGPLLTKEFGGAARQRLKLDWHDLAASLSVEQRLSLLTRWVQQAQQSGASWSLRLPDNELAEGHGDAHYHACLKALALHGTTD
jgi:uncharacterized protein (DUF58 family)